MVLYERLKIESMFAQRRTILTALLSLPIVAGCGPAEPAPVTPGRQDDTTGRLADLERRYGVRLGVFGLNVATGRSIRHRQDERFAMCSTFKTYAAAALLKAHTELTNSPVTETKVDTGMTVSELCEAAIAKSDNAAGNQLLKLLGGPEAVTRFARSIGDTTTRLDRWEPELNRAMPGDERDTTTPAAIAGAYQALALGEALPVAERERLKSWLIASTTGNARIRAGLPHGWVTGDKTGSGDYATANDVAITWTDIGHPLVLAVLSDKATVDAQYDNALHADTARIAAETLR
jgi:beta-lactamase class A